MTRLDMAAAAEKDNASQNDWINEELLGAIQSGDIEFLLPAIAALQQNCDINSEVAGGVSPGKEVPPAQQVG